MSAGEEAKSTAPPKPTVEDAPTEPRERELVRRDSQTASEWVDSQLKLEAEAREALPYSFDSCTRPLGSLRQNVFACLTCHPPPTTTDAAYTPAGICYGCSISCHGEHTLVEIFARRNFTCDCGTTRLPDSTPCMLRVNAATGRKGRVKGEEPDAQNEYNHNFRNRFCGCADWYVAEEQRGTMYQCLGLSSEADGGCGEDWWHPECLLGLPRDWYKTSEVKQENPKENGTAETNGGEGEDHPVPPGFPDEDDFTTLICYKCTEKNPWLKAYGDSKGFMILTFKKPEQAATSDKITAPNDPGEAPTSTTTDITAVLPSSSAKRKAEGDVEVEDETSLKRARTEQLLASNTDIRADPIVPSSGSHIEAADSQVDPSTNPSSTIASATIDTSKDATTEPTTTTATSHLPKHAYLPPPPPASQRPFSLLPTTEDWRELLCRCATCYPHLKPLPQLLEEEETYQPPLSSDGNDGNGSGVNGGVGNESVGTGSLLDRGEAALNNVDRVRAIEGVMVYNHLRDKVKAFLAPFAESGQAVGAKDVEEYFARLRGDDEAIREAGRKVREQGEGGRDAEDGTGGGAEEDQRRGQSGY